jgi:hypothetical protein
MSGHEGLKVAIMVPNVDLVVVHKALVPAICLPLSEWLRV